MAKECLAINYKLTMFESDSPTHISVLPDLCNTEEWTHCPESSPSQSFFTCTIAQPLGQFITQRSTVMIISSQYRETRIGKLHSTPSSIH